MWHTHYISFFLLYWNTNLLFQNHISIYQKSHFFHYIKETNWFVEFTFLYCEISNYYRNNILIYRNYKRLFACIYMYLCLSKIDIYFDISFISSSIIRQTRTYTYKSKLRIAILIITIMNFTLDQQNKCLIAKENRHKLYHNLQT